MSFMSFLALTQTNTNRLKRRQTEVSHKWIKEISTVTERRDWTEPFMTLHKHKPAPSSLIGRLVCDVIILTNVADVYEYC